MTILEAARFAKPMVAPDHGGFTEIIGRGEDAIGMLFAPGNIDSFDEMVASMWGDLIKTQLLGAKSYVKLQKQYSTEVVVDKWNALLAQMTNV